MFNYIFARSGITKGIQTRITNFQSPPNIFPALSEPCSPQSIQNMRGSIIPAFIRLCPRIYPTFSRPIEFIMPLWNWNISFRYSECLLLYPALDILCCASLLRGQKPAVALVYGCGTVTGALDHFTPFHWDLESNRPSSHGVSSVSPIQKIFKCTSTDTIFHCSIVCSGAI